MAINKNCLQCGKTIKPKSKQTRNQIYCSKSCCWKHWDAQRPQSRNEYKKEYQKKWIAIPKNREKIRYRQRIWGVKALRTLKLKIIDKYGGKCNRCGFNDWRALQIDHVNSNGYQERELIRKRRTYYKYVLEDKSGNYQILCANCNWIKKYENNEN